MVGVHQKQVKTTLRINRKKKEFKGELTGARTGQEQGVEVFETEGKKKKSGLVRATMKKKGVP